MVNLSKFVHTKNGKIIMSLLLGFGLATIFRSICKGKDCVIFMAPPLEEIKDKIYKHDDKCYQYNPVSTKCSYKKKIVEFSQTDM